MKTKGTVFDDLDDDHILDGFDFHEFEEAFKLASGSTASKVAAKAPAVQLKKPTGPDSVLKPDRARNLGKGHRCLLLYCFTFFDCLGSMCGGARRRLVCLSFVS